MSKEELFDDVFPSAEESAREHYAAFEALQQKAETKSRALPETKAKPQQKSSRQAKESTSQESARRHKKRARPAEAIQADADHGPRRQLTTRLSAATLRHLKKACGYQASREADPQTQQDIIEEALSDWFEKIGFAMQSNVSKQHG